MTKIHSHYSINRDADGFYINHYMYIDSNATDIRRETIYSGIPTEEEAYQLEKLLTVNATYLEDYKLEENQRND